MFVALLKTIFLECCFEFSRILLARKILCIVSRANRSSLSRRQSHLLIMHPFDLLSLLEEVKSSPLLHMLSIFLTCFKRTCIRQPVWFIALAPQFDIIYFLQTPAIPTKLSLGDNLSFITRDRYSKLRYLLLRVKYNQNFLIFTELLFSDKSVPLW